MNNFKIGDIVECIEAKNAGSDLTKGTQYTIASIESGDMLKLSHCPYRSFYLKRFKLISRNYIKPTQKFYMIYREGQRMPEVRRDSAAKATAEAQRLARKHPGNKVFILETVDCFMCSVSEPESVELEKTQ